MLICIILTWNGIMEHRIHEIWRSTVKERVANRFVLNLSRYPHEMCNAIIKIQKVWL